MSKLEGKTGTDFDKAFAEHAIKDHSEAQADHKPALVPTSRLI